MKYILLFFFSFLSFAQQIEKVDFKKLNAAVYPDAINKSIQGSCTFEFVVKKNIDTIKIDAKNMQIKEVFVNNKSIQFINNGKELLFFEGYKLGKNTISFQYVATPKQTLYFVKIGNETQIWTQGQGKYTSHWLPSFDDVNEKMVFNMKVTFNYISNFK